MLNLFLVPTEPLNVIASQINGSRIQVSWNQPTQSNGHLEGYTVYHRPQSSSITVQSVRISAAEQSVIIESDFQGNITYEIWVKARNRKHESTSSKLIQLTFDGASNIDSLVGLVLSPNDNGSIQLSWTKIQRAQGYIVQLVLPHPYPRVEPIKTTNTSITIDNLVNGAQYVARVSAYVGNYTGRSQSLIMRRPGIALPEISNIVINQEDENVRVSWKKPTVPGYEMNENKLEYGVYYGTNLEDLFDLPKLKTFDTTILLTKVYECQSYLIGVGIIGPIGPGPLGKNPRSFETLFREQTPPKNLQAKFDENNHSMIITWDHSCPLKSINAYPKYIVS